MKNHIPLILLLCVFTLICFPGQSQLNAQPCALCGTTASEWIAGISVDGSSGPPTPGGMAGGCYAPVLLDGYYVILKKGVSHSFALVPGFSGAAQSEYWKIWIDLNHDGDLGDPGELVYSSGSGSATTVSGSFFIPLSVSAGPCAMRVAMRRGSAPPDCGNFTNGQVITFTTYLDECDISFYDACMREYIQKVRVKTIDNTSVCGASGYQDFTNFATTLNAGNAYPLQLIPGFFGANQHPERWLIWIDFNKDYDFDDPGENVFDSGAIGTSDTIISSINIPLAAPTVTTRMRIKMIPTDVNTVTLNPCDPLPILGFSPDQYGEAEDYTVNIQAQGVAIEVHSGLSPESLVKDMLVGGDCYDVSNVSFSGQNGQIGSFGNGLASIGFATGVILATGDVNIATGPNDQDAASGGYGVSTGDNDLGGLTGGTIFDMAALEFDITPTQSPLTLNFVFASEEYCEYVNTQFNDVFGFFISGPGFAGDQNIAVVPTTTTPVSINSVNHLINTGYYVNNTPADGTLCGQTGSVLPAVNAVQYDGFTKPMVASAQVIPCQTYHIKLKIADVGDGIFDSALFMKAGSFDAGAKASVHWEVNGDPDAGEVFESCGGAKLVFTRLSTNVSSALAVSYTVSGTATSNVDYSTIPTVVVIPAGQSTVTLNVNIITDALTEGAESLIITLSNPCSCLNPQEILLIKDQTALVAIADTVTICGPGIGTVSVNPTSGAPPYTYQWSNGTTDPDISVFVSTSTNYKVTVTDACGKTIVATARINVTPPPSAQLLGPAPQLCSGQEAPLHVNFNGTGPFTISYNFNGIPNTITDIVDDPYDLVINEPGLYVLNYVIDGSGCSAAGQGALLVLASTLNLSGVLSNVNCNGASNGTINTTVVGGQGPYAYTWAGPTTVGNIPDPTGLKAGTYNVTVTDGFGCQSFQQFMLNEPAAIAPAITDTQMPNCTNPNGGSINLSVSGGTPNYNYSWSNGQTVQDPQGLSAGTYTVTVTDQVGCVKTATATVTGNFVAPNAAVAVTGAITCNTPVLMLDGTNSSTGANFTYKWTANPGNIVSGSSTLYPVVNQPGTYTFLVTNTANGCTSSLSVQVTGNITPPVSEAGPIQTLACNVTNIPLNGAGSSTGPGFTYQWTATQGGVIISGGTTLNPIVASTGNYTLVVTNTANGCTASDFTQVIVTTLLISASVNGNVITVQASGGTGFLEYSINGVNFQAANQFTNLACGNYTVTVRDANGCKATSSATVNVLSGSFETPAILCAGGQTTISLKPICGVPPFKYALGNGAFQSDSTFIGLSAGTYNLSIRDANNTTIVVGPVVIDEPQQLVVTSMLNCNDAMLTITGGTPPYASDPSDLQNLPNGTYQVTATDNHGCTATTNLIVDVLPLGVSSVTDSVLCFGDNTGSITANGVGGCPPYTYSLNGPAFQTSNAFPNLAVGTYTLTVKDSKGNLSPAYLTVFQPPLFHISTMVDGNNITANATGGTSPYQYRLNGGPPQNSGIFGGLDPGTYTVLSTDANGCMDSVENLLVTIGTVEPAREWGLSVSPNPSTGLFVLTLHTSVDALRAEVLDVTGRILQTIDLQPIDGHLTRILDLQDLPQGTYLLRVTDGYNWGGVRLSKVGGR